MGAFHATGNIIMEICCVGKHLAMGSHIQELCCVGMLQEMDSLIQEPHTECVFVFHQARYNEPIVN